MRELKFEQGSREWHEARSGMVTGTTFARATGTVTVQKTLMYELLAGMMTEPKGDVFLSEAVERGNDMEPIALKAAIKALGKDFETTGMMVSGEIEKFGTSPDAVCRESDRIVGGIEIKCPDSKKHLEYVMKDVIPSEPKNNYRAQILAMFLVNPDVQWWYFMSFDDRNYEIPEFYKLITRAEVNEELISLRKTLIKFVANLMDVYLKLTF